MFNNTFYPTPDPVIELMLAPHVKTFDEDEDTPHSYFRGRRFLTGFRNILDPSAGKGDILDYMQKKFDRNDHKFFCIEIEPELQMILIEKGYKSVGYDFLDYAERFSYDLIIMNPPFDKGVAHLLHAWELMQDGSVICLLNAESVDNPYTAERKILAEVIQKHGSVERIGQAFKDSERPTDVEVVIVRLKKERSDTPFEFDAMRMDKDGRVSEEAFSANPLAHTNVIKALVDQYNRAQTLEIELHRLESEYSFYMRNIIHVRKDADEDEVRRVAQLRRESTSKLNDKLVDLKKHFWRYVFEKTNLGSKMTSKFQKDFETKLDQTSSIAFTEQNVIMVLEAFMFNINQIVKDCIVSVFDQATSYHEKNKIHSEGWKHNKSWRMAPLIIMPDSVKFEKRDSGPDHWGMDYWRREFLTDLDKAMCFLDGKKFEQIMSVYGAMDRRCDYLNDNRLDQYNFPIESTFFIIKFYKKGTVHLLFKDKLLLDRFNQVAAENKKWVGDGS